MQQYYYRPRTKYDGRLCFDRCVSVQNFEGGGYPIEVMGVIPSQVQAGRGDPIQLTGGYPIPGPGGGYPHPADGHTLSQLQDGGYPIQLMGVPYPRTWDGIPPSKIWDGVPHRPGTWDGVSPPVPNQDTEQHSEHLPLAFTQEDFLVFNYFLPKKKKYMFFATSLFL